jgi:hypothetical protein
MKQAVLRIVGLPGGALDAAAQFHQRELPHVRAALGDAEALALVFPPAPYDHRGWRLAAVQDLAREAAPKRVNAVAGDDEQAVAKTLAWLEQAPGITGQLLAVDGKSGAKD